MRAAFDNTVSNETSSVEGLVFFSLLDSELVIELLDIGVEGTVDDRTNEI